ncbi:TPA: hypothetical protein N0F65_011543 [Lagenidium giganteum]|uniref:Reverse transcriptase domain-containing protein n=1 Tax=Lagenidium giganteum TaxID=4803 RepID=A0AAV2Z812_9STRA|nr:TPA: hypothetical protein N0F65_011543 [Lagenidium giganteum]
MCAAPKEDVLTTEWLGHSPPYKTLTATQQEKILQDITTDEVRWSIRQSKRTKATGPDRLPNDFYRNLEEELIPILTTVLNAWIRTGEVPRSFLHASIFPLKNVAAPNTGLDFRPLAMLNTDFKMFKRILAKKTRPLISHLIHPAQSGFVPERSIHTTIRQFQRAKDAVSHDDDRKDACSVQVDFKKAYDTIARGFLCASLEHLGFPEAFTTLIKALHEGTTAYCSVDGYKAQPMDVTCGIRQGCPFAPQLFVLALDSLYRRIQQHTGLHGVQLPQQDGGCLKVAGYADDTSIYLRSKAELATMDTILDAFAVTSGLTVNKNKTAFVNLRTDGDTTRTAYIVTPATTPTRYLGVPVATKENRTETWHNMMHQLQVRLGMAERKTSNVMHRIHFVKAIAILKIQFVSQHVWPTAAITRKTQKLLHHFIWSGDLQDTVVKAKYNPRLAARPAVEGGLDYPILRQLLFAQAAAVVARRHRSHQMPQPMQPSRGPATIRKLEGDIERVGTQVLREYYAQRRASDERDAIQQALQEVDSGNGPTYEWRNGHLRIDYSQWKPALDKVTAIQTQCSETQCSDGELPKHPTPTARRARAHG